MRAFLVLLMAAAAIPGAARAEPMFRGDARHSGVYDAQGPREFHRVRWAFPTGNRVVSSPVMQGGIVYFGSDDGSVYAVDAESGRQLWRHATQGPVPSTPAVAGDTVYVGSYDGRFYALDARTGATRWKFRTEGERRFEAKGLHGATPSGQTYFDTFDIYLSSPVVAGDAVYFGSGDGHLYALDRTDGTLRWKFHTGDVVHASPAYADGVLYFGSWDSYFYAVDAKTGQEKWRFHGGEDPVIHNQVGFQGSAAVVDGVVYVGCRDSNIYALDAATGKEKWRIYNGGSWVITSPAVTDGKVVFATSDTSLFHVVEAQTGKAIAKQQGKAYMFGSPAVARGVVYQPVMNGTLQARDLATGDLLWEYRTEASRENAAWALTAEGRINGPMLYRSSNGESNIVAGARQFAIGAMFSSPLVADNTVYVGSTDGFMYALE
ncbi:MAG TPA: PQQ-binding-like beta-propeller repeat protein [Usitatibacter sp.]|nr:PQQ-binding-like beta-propeller repeat protein [Usitatibacter sp.]